MRLYPRKKKNGERVWWASWTEGAVTVRRSTRCSTKPAAEIVVARWERERADPVLAALGSATFGEEAGQFLKRCRVAMNEDKLAPGTFKMYEQKAAVLVRIIGKDTRLASLGNDAFESYLEERGKETVRKTSRPITESTKYKEWVTFRGILKSAARRGRFSRDPGAFKPPHWGPDYRPRQRFLTWPEVSKLLAALPGRRRGAVAFAICAGARRAEVFAAQDGDVDVRRHTVRVRGTKTDTSDRTIPIPKPMRALMTLHCYPPFPTWGNARRELARACKKAKIAPVTWNDLRRTFASLLVQAGVDPYLVGKLQGHTTSAMVEKVYGRQTHESLGLLVERQLQNTREPTVNHRRRSKASSRRRGGNAK